MAQADVFVDGPTTGVAAGDDGSSVRSGNGAHVQIGGPYREPTGPGIAIDRLDCNAPDTATGAVLNGSVALNTVNKTCFSQGSAAAGP